MADTVFAAECSVQTAELGSAWLGGGVVAGEPAGGFGDDLGLAAPVAGLVYCCCEGGGEEQQDAARMAGKRHVESARLW